MKLNLMNFLFFIHLIIKLVEAFAINKTILEELGYTKDSIKIDLSNKGILTIDPTTFHDFPKLEILYLHENIIDKIELGTFSQLLNLKELWLESNNLVSMPKNVVAGLNNLRLFCMYNNPLSTHNPSQVASLCNTNKICELEMTESCKNKVSTTRTSTKEMITIPIEIITAYTIAGTTTPSNIIMSSSSALNTLTTTFIPTIIESPLITNWGVWQPEEKCSPKNYVVGFQSKVEAACTNPFLDECDNSAMNGISLLCSPELKKIKSGEQRFGDWGSFAQCPSNERVLGFKIKVQPPQGSGDDTATNAIRLKCESGYELISSEERWGDWSDWIYCPKNTYFCGVQTQIEPFQFWGDDTALNNVRFTCCQ